MCSRGQGGHVGAASPHWGLTAGEIAVDDHRWPSAGVGGRMTGGVASSERERRAGEGARLAGRSGRGKEENVRARGPSWAKLGQRERGGLREGGERASVGHAVHLGRAREERE
jgi:hypothetical protein